MDQERILHLTSFKDQIIQSQLKNGFILYNS